MTFLSPGFLAAAAVGALVVVALHFLSFQRPRPRPLPTARFVPERPLRSVATFRRPTDAALLALRALALLLVGAAFAEPVRAPRRGTIARLFLVDRSRAVASGAEAADSVRGLAGPADALVLFDSAAAPAARLADAGAIAAVEARGSLSAGLAALGRASRLVRTRADSVEVVLVSPLVGEQLDEATVALRRGWPGRIRVVRVAAAPPPADSAPAGLELAGAAADDPLAATASLLGGVTRSAAGARVLRGNPTAADAAWVGQAAGRRLVLWPADGRPSGWGTAPPDTSGALVAGGATVVAPFTRTARLPAGRAGRVIARWVDGVPAAVERPLGAGCVREVGVAVPSDGDLPITASFVRLSRALVAPCGEPRDWRPVDAATRAALAGRGPLAVAAALGGPSDGASPLAKWLLVAAAATLVAELALRRGPRVPSAEAAE